MTIKLSKDEIAELVAERELELEHEAERVKFEKSLRTLAKRMAKKEFYIGKSLFSHMEKEESNKWCVTTYRSN